MLYTLGNKYLQRRFILKDGKFRTASIKNKLTEREFKVNSQEFFLKIDESIELSGNDFTVKDISQRKQGSLLIVKLENRKYEIEANLYYILGTSDFYMRKYLVVKGKTYLVNYIEVERFKINNEPIEAGGFGQPLFIGKELFIGLEYPAGYNIYSKKKRLISVSHYPGRKGEIISKKAVIGVCPDTVNNRIRDWFLKYIDINRAMPVKGFFNSYYQIRLKGSGSGMKVFKSLKYWAFDRGREVYYKRGIHTDAILMVANQAWLYPQSIMGEKPEAEQLLSLRLIQKEAREKIGAEMGFHVVTSGGRGGTCDFHWLAQHFDMISDKYYCRADPRVKNELKKNLLHLVKKYNARWFAFDWLWWKKSWECPKRDHRGHLPGIRYSREAITDSFIELTIALRRARPDIVLSGIQVELSPWWVLYVDSLWDYTGEGTVLSHEEIDGSLRGWLTKNTFFPFNSISHNGEYSPDITSQRDKKRLLNRFGLENKLLKYLRGGQLLYCNSIGGLERYTSKGIIDELVQVIRWADSQKKIFLTNTSIILGDARKNQTYGYSHFMPDNEGIIGIRNPALWKSEKIKLKLDENAHFFKIDDAQHVIKIIYPYEEVLPCLYRYGDSLELEVQGGQLLILKVMPLDKVKEPLLANCRYKELRRGRSKVTYQLIGIPGEEARLSLINPEGVRKIHIDEKVLMGTTWTVRLKGKKRVPFRLEQVRIEPSEKNDQDKSALKGSFYLHISPEEKARLWFCVDLYEREREITEYEGKKTEEMDTLTKKMEVLKQASEEVLATVKCRGKNLEVIKIVKNFKKKVVWIGMHPRKRGILFSRVMYSSSVSGGKVEFTLKVDDWRYAEVHLWVEREIALVPGSIIKIDRTKSLPEKETKYQLPLHLTNKRIELQSIYQHSLKDKIISGES